MSSFRKDIAPGEPHIALRRKGISYYVPSLFHLAPTNQKIVPLLIRDVLRSKNPLEIYGPRGLKINQEGCILIKNHPVKTLRVFGRLMLFTTHNFPGFHGSGDYEYYLLYLDDFLGEKLLICVKVLRDIICLNKLEGHILVEVTGTVATNRDGAKEIQASEVKVLGSNSDISVELAWWASALATRKFLARPWVYIPPKPSIEHRTPKIVFENRDSRAILQKKRILRPVHGEMEQEITEYLATDSFSLYHGKDSVKANRLDSYELPRSFENDSLVSVQKDPFRAQQEYDRDEVVEIIDD